jgi:hypothetical protein
MTLTEYELADLAINMQASTTPTTALFVTIASGYLIAAWMVGEKLTRTQVTFINLLFGAFELAILAGWASRWIVTTRYGSALASIDPVFYETTPLNTLLLVLLGSVMFLTILGCLKFMWDIRHPKD